MHHSHNATYTKIRSALFLGAAMAVLAPAAMAQEASTEAVVVTGTRIASPDAVAAAPLTVISAQAITTSKTVTVEQILNKMPEMGQQGSNDQNSISPGGFSTVDLRALGSSRTLILLNGERMVDTFANGYQAQDLSNVPMSMIDHIEVLKDGASPIYGADAIGGVINIITRKDFTGIEFTGGAGVSTYGDHFTKQMGVTVGVAGQKAGFVGSMEWYSEDPVQQKNRVWATYQYPINLYGAAYAIGYSTATPTGNVYSPGRYCGTATGGLTAGGCAVFDTTQDPDLIQGRNVLNANFSAHYDFSDSLSFFVESYFTNRKSAQRLNPEPVGYNYTSYNFPQGTFIAATNPNNPFPGHNTLIKKRLYEVGDRLFNDNVDTYQERVGLRGKLPYGDWTWDAAFQYGASDDAMYENNAVNEEHLHELTGQVPCGAFAPTGCGGVTLLGTNSLTPAQVAYVRYTSQENSRFHQKMAYADASGTLPFLTLPGGAVGAAVGFTYRRDDVNAIPDSMKYFGDDAEGNDYPTRGYYDVTEFYAELKVPVLKDVPFAQDLSFDFAARASQFSNFGFAGVYKGSVNWAVTDWLRFRGDYGTGVRAPQVGDELYLGQEQSADGYSDPCKGNPTNPTVLANCRASIGSSYNPATFTQTAPQLTATIIGNSALKPEKSNQYNLGVVFTPDAWIPGLSASVDYYNIHINQEISTIDEDTALNLCYTSTNMSANMFCALFGPRDVTGQVSTFQKKLLNLNWGHTDGIDFDLHYNTQALNDLVGLPSDANFSFGAQATLMNSNINQNSDGSTTQYAGIWTQGAVSTALPKWKAYFTQNLELAGGYSFGITERFVGETTDTPALSAAESGGPQDKLTGSNPGDIIPALVFFDVNATIPYGDNYSLNLGIDNLFDKNPPFAFDTYVQTVSNQYDMAGRFFYFKVKAKF